MSEPDAGVVTAVVVIGDVPEPAALTASVCATTVTGPALLDVLPVGVVVGAPAVFAEPPPPDAVVVDELAVLADEVPPPQAVSAATHRNDKKARVKRRNLCVSECMAQWSRSKGFRLLQAFFPLAAPQTWPERRRAEAPRRGRDAIVR